MVPRARRRGHGDPQGPHPGLALVPPGRGPPGPGRRRGVEHPTLVGLHTPEGAQHPLVHWLDPAYGAHLPSKLKIQAKATERYAKLAAGGSLAGLTLADVQKAEAGLLQVGPPGAWQATPAQVVEAMAGVNRALAELDWAGSPAEVATRLGAVVAAENHLARAACPDMGAGLEAAKGSVRAALDKALEQAPSYQRDRAVAELVAEARKADTIGEAEAALLARDEQLDLLRLSTPSPQRAGLSKLAAERQAKVQELAELRQLYLARKDLSAADASTAAGREHLAALAGAAGSYFAKRAEVAGWAQGVPGVAELKATHGPLWTASSSYNPDAQALTASFRAWAKGQKLADLRAVAKDLGMDPEGASRAQIQNYIAASWDPKLDKAQIQAAVGAAKAGKGAPKTPGPPKSVTAGSAPLSAGPTLAAPAPPGPSPPSTSRWWRPSRPTRPSPGTCRPGPPRPTWTGGRSAPARRPRSAARTPRPSTGPPTARCGCSSRTRGPAGPGPTPRPRPRRSSAGRGCRASGCT